MIVVNSGTRQFTVPGADLVFGVTADSGSERKDFQCPRYVGNNLDIAGSFVRINYRNANGEIDSYLVDDLTVDGDNVVFSWVLTPKVTRYKGQVKFVMCVVGPDLKVKWHTTMGTGQVLEGLEPDSDTVEAETADVVAQLIAMVEAQTAAVEAEGGKQIKAVQAAAKTAEAASVAEIDAKGVNTLGSIPEDYTALQSAVDALNRTRGAAIVCEAAGETVVVSDASDLPMQGLRIFGKSTQDGTPTPEAPVEIKSVENPTISVNEQTLSILRTLPGIPVTSGGNYTDSDGQQWICDEVDFERGVYVQRVHTLEITKFNALSVERNNRLNVVLPYERLGDYTKAYALCSHATYNHTVHWDTGTEKGFVVNKSSVMFRFGSDGVFDSLDTANAWLQTYKDADTPLAVSYALTTPIETPLSETEIAAYRALHSNYPNTTILNDGGAHMVVKYAADTKLYIDNKIAALAAQA